MPPSILVRKATVVPKSLAIHFQPKGNQHGRSGATVIMPGMGMMDASERKEYIAIVNERNKTHIKVEDVEKAVEDRMTGKDRKPDYKRFAKTGKW